MAEASKGRGRGRGIRTGVGDQSSTGTVPSVGRGRGSGRGVPAARGDGNRRQLPGGGDETVPSQTLEEQFASVTLEEEGGDIAPKQLISKPSEALQQAMARPGVGTLGRRIPLFANHFPLKIPPNMCLQQYDLVIGKRFKRKKGTGPASKPKQPLVRRQRNDDDEDDDLTIEEVVGEEGDFEIVLRRRTKWPKWIPVMVYQNLVSDPAFGLTDYRLRMAFDGRRNVFAQCALPVPVGDGYTMELQLPDERKTETFVVELNRVAEIKVDLREVFNRNLVERRSMSSLVLDVILRQSKMFSHVFIPFGPRAFYRPQNPVSLGGGIWHYPGIWESVRPVSGWKSTINLDLANTAIVKSGPLLNFLDEIARNWQNRELTKNEIVQLEKLVKDLKVNLTHHNPHRSARCVGVTKDTARNLTFECDVAGGGTAPISVERYFREKHGRNEFARLIQYPLLPCLHVGNKAKANYVPLEFCEIKDGQRFNRKLSDQQTAAMLKAASQSAPDRKRKVEEEFNRFGLANDPFVKSFGLTIDSQMLQLNGRILPAPIIEYDKKVPVTPQDGGWNMRNNRVLRGTTIRNYGVINTDPYCKLQGQESIENFFMGLIREAGKLGITFMNQKPVMAGDWAQAEGLDGVIKQIKEKAVDPNTKESTLDMVFIILEKKNTAYYASAKSAGDVVLGISTQCILGKNVRKADTMTMINLLLKVNAKLGGVNSKLVDGSTSQIRQLREPVLIIGADVNHPAPTDSLSAQSVAAVVANVDGLPAQYLARIMVQRRRQEPIEELQHAVEEMIFNFHKRNGVLPYRIVMYRDGVGESMFLKVLTHELHSIRRACETMGKHFKQEKYEPPITFIVVQKRHHTRLFCVNSADEKGRGRNIPPGTTVDTMIVHPEENDFYLCSHLGLQGTSRPTHYHVLWDDSNFTADELQLLTYFLCYTYARAMKSVSIPPPVYYADLVAYRARQYLAWKLPSGSDATSSGSSGSVVSVAEMQNYVAVNENIANKGMYFV